MELRLLSASSYASDIDLAHNQFSGIFGKKKEKQKISDSLRYKRSYDLIGIASNLFSAFSGPLALVDYLAFLYLVLRHE